MSGVLPWYLVKVASGHDKLLGKAASVASCTKWSDTVLQLPTTKTAHPSLALIRDLLLATIHRHVTMSTTSDLDVK